MKPDSETSHKCRAILISVIGAKVYDVLADLCSHVSPATKTYVELTAVLKEHFGPKKLVISERYRLYSCSQAANESVSSFVASLKWLATMCNFGTHLNEALRDRFVCGLQSDSMKKKILTAEDTFKQAIKIALSIEMAE